MLPRYNQKLSVFSLVLSLLLILNFTLRTSAQQVSNISNATLMIENATLGIKNFTSSLQPWSVYLVIILLFAFASLPILWNIKGFYDHMRDVRNLLGEKLSTGCNQAELINLVKDALTIQSSGMQGVARATMALTLSVILGAAIFLLILNPSAQENSMLKDILLALTGAISSIIGFYFGGRATQSTEQQKGGGGSPAPSQAAKLEITSFDPKDSSTTKPGNVKLSCTVKNPSGRPLQYKFEVWDENNNWVNGTNYQKDSYWTWNNAAKGKYVIRVSVKDDIGGYAEKENKIEIKD
ncbi:MAG: hypothetical protein QFX31_07295 [Methanothrix sp.]|uniref:hypothetical protein n=1 Tax=Methanothrix sp. TaxID=90426 RepID=UPI0032AEF674|nr:hypothetical protein [Methanothrix sp.]